MILKDDYFKVTETQNRQDGTKFFGESDFLDIYFSISKGLRTNSLFNITAKQHEIISFEIISHTGNSPYISPQHQCCR
jgi:hypothetical protein